MPSTSFSRLLRTRSLPSLAGLCMAFALLLGSPARAFGVELDLGKLCDSYFHFDQDGDGLVEIEFMRWLRSEGEEGARVLVLVEQRLVGRGTKNADLDGALARLVEDLALEGNRAELISVKFAPTPTHRDGRLLLALREFVRAVAEEELAGVVLVGRFPDAFLVRTCNWRKRGPLNLPNGMPEPREYDDVPYLRRVPEPVAWRADIVLADLDGRWEECYVEPRTSLETFVGAYPDGIPAAGGPCDALQLGTVDFEDFFLIDDGALIRDVVTAADGVTRIEVLKLDDRQADSECSDRDRESGNPLALPDINVSRIDARGSALRPVRSLRGDEGRGLLDDEGQPRALTMPDGDELPHWSEDLWEEDPDLELQLLVEYFDRNHAFRTGNGEVTRRPTSIACDLGSGFNALHGASAKWESYDLERADVKGRPTLADFVDWLRYPALLRTLRAHSDPWGSVFAKGSVDELMERIDGPAWSWTPQGTRLVPSLDGACGGGKLDWFLLRTLWEADALPSEPSFYLHTGCHGISPPGADKLAYDHPDYGRRQGAEALLFFARGLTLVGRAKVFYDEPRGFAEVLAQGGTLGDTWARYFELERAAAKWSEVGGDIGRKRAYFWSVLGDWTLRLNR